MLAISHVKDNESYLPHEHDCWHDMAKRKDWKSEPPSIDAKTGGGEQVAEEAAEVGGHVARA